MDFVHPRFWYPMSSLEQSTMELEQMSDAMMHPRLPFDMHHGSLPTATSDSSDDEDNFFVDLPVVAYMSKPTALQLDPEVGLEDEDERSMDVDDDSSGKRQTSTQDKKKDDNANKTEQKGKHQKSSTRKKQPRKHSYKVTPSAETKTTATTGADSSTYTSYSFSNSSMVDDKGRRVSTTRRRYEDSTGRLKAVHKREIDGKTLRTTWSRQSKQDEGRHESVCSSGSPDEFETLWQQTPFGEAQKKKVKGLPQLQSPRSDSSETPL